MNAPSVDDRFARLEGAVAHLERLCDQLNAVVTEQDRELGRLRKRLEQLSEDLESGEQERLRQHQEKPPHWGP